MDQGNRGRRPQGRAGLSPESDADGSSVDRGSGGQGVLWTETRGETAGSVWTGSAAQADSCWRQRGADGSWGQWARRSLTP